MITPTIYAQLESQIASDLLPVRRRKAKFLVWLSSLLQPVQWLHDLIFTDYYVGSSASDWVTGLNYSYGDRVKDIDYKIYELMTIGGLTPSTIAPHLDTANWFAVLDTFVGVSERVKYTGQKIMLEYLLNKYFGVPFNLPFAGANTTGQPPFVPQIYVSEIIGITSEFWLSDGGVGGLTSFMSNNTNFQGYYMGNAYSLYTFTIFVPASVDADITANQVAGVTAEQVVRAIADKYVQAGYIYKYDTF